MKIRLPVTWEMCGTVEVEANSIGDAIVFFDPDEHDLPDNTNSDYVDGSFQLTDSDPCFVELFNHPSKVRQNL